MPELTPTKDKALIGAAGVHFVASELSLRGLVALATVRNTAGVDIVAVNPSGTWHANIQVKTSRSNVKFWPVSKHFDSWVHRNNYYVFVRYIPKQNRFEAFLESSIAVATHLRKRIEYEQSKGLKEWAPCWFLDGREEVLAAQWKHFGTNPV